MKFHAFLPRARISRSLAFLGRLAAGGLAAGGLASRAAETKLPDTVEFNRDIRPIMSNTCFKCHGPDVKNNKSDVRLDLPESAYAAHTDKSGRKTIPLVPGKPAESEAWRRIVASDATVAMPPPDSLHQLSARDKALFKKWIDHGAKYQPHWAYVPPKKAPLPAVANPGQARNAIDHFILQELDREGLAPSPEADRATLLRRVSLDLTGLPPTPEETRAFVEDTSPDAYEKVVDRLLASEHYGERMAVPWLDLVRFADSVGFHGDQLLNNFPYRDYVVASFNRNKPFDRFTEEQLAGDLLEKGEIEQLVATGFNRLNMVTREGGAQSKEYLAKYAADRVRTVAGVWLGSTVGCAECHDHKYDPFKTRDFYALAAYFADIKQWGVYGNADVVEPELRGYNNHHPFPPEIEVPSAYLQRRLARQQARFDADLDARTRAFLDDARNDEEVHAWTTAVADRIAADPGGWTPAKVETTELSANISKAADKEADRKVAAKVKAAVQPDASVRLTGVLVTGYETITCVAEVPAGPLAALRLELIPDATQGGSLLRAYGSGEKDPKFYALRVDAPEVSIRRAGQTTLERVTLAGGFTEVHSEGYYNGRRQNPLGESWDLPPPAMKFRHVAAWQLAQPLVLRDGDRLVVKVQHTGMTQFRLAVSPLGLRLPDRPLSPDEAAAFAASSPSAAQRTILAREFLKGSDALDRAGRQALLQDLAAMAECNGGFADTVVTEAKVPTVTRVLPRGDWQNESGDIVLPAPPQFLPGAAAATSDATHRATRLDLAKWLVSRDNPLTSRTFVNRLWKQFFGTGLSAVVDDLGLQGEYPSHPELLDWLAVEFMDRGWDVKAMVRLIVTSATYRQSSRYRPELAERDPYNRLLARQSPRRLDAEFVRDNALFAAGLLDLELGGPSVFPYQPEGYYAALMYPDRDYVANTDERQYRRGLYMHWQRTFLHPMLNNFDASSREECLAARPLSTTPLQALTLLNDPSFVEAARVLAADVLEQSPGKDFAARLDAAVRRVLGRPATAKESTSLGKFFQGQLAYYRDQPGDARKLVAVGNHPLALGLDPAELAAWTAVARALLNLNETIVRY